MDFFGGEPLLNWEVVRETIAYARKAGAAAGKQFIFTLTTNATLLTPALLAGAGDRQAGGALCPAGGAPAPEGDLYPCHQFVGRPEWLLGNVREGVARRDLQEKLAGCHIYTKEGCGDCWARYYCSGGCHANADLLEGDIFKPDRIGCELAKKRFECALWLKAQEALS